VFESVTAQTQAFASFQFAEPGSYRARSTGVVFEHPDLIIQWSVALEHEADLDAADWAGDREAPELNHSR
jgi:hypothetical protein